LKETIDRWEAGLILLIEERYRCTRNEALAIRAKFLDYQADAMMLPMELDADGRPVLPEEALVALDGCAAS
jgi:hypothetical protein